MDFGRCYNEAEGAFLAGGSIPAIAARYSVSIERLRGWMEKYCWEAKKSAAITNPRDIGVMLREKLRKQVEACMSAPELDVVKVEEITKLTLLITKIEGAGGNILAAMVEVLRDFSRYLRENIGDRDQYHLVSSWVQEYLRTKADV